MNEGAISAGLSRETTIRRDAEGRWFHDGESVENPAVSRAFDRWVARAPDGRLCLENDVNWAYVHIDGAPVFVRRARWEEGAIQLELSDERTETLQTDTLRQDANGKLYCTVRSGQLAAEWSREAMFDLSERVEEDEVGIYLDLGEHRVRPPVREWPVVDGY